MAKSTALAPFLMADATPSPTKFGKMQFDTSLMTSPVCALVASNSPTSLQNEPKSDSPALTLNTRPMMVSNLTG